MSDTVELLPDIYDNNNTVESAEKNEDSKEDLEEINLDDYRNSLPVNVISAGYSSTAGIKKDGTVVATGDNEYDKCKIFNWTDIKTTR